MHTCYLFILGERYIEVFDRNSACAPSKSLWGRWAVSTGFGISPRGRGEYRQEAWDPAPDQHFLGGGWSPARASCSQLAAAQTCAPGGALREGPWVRPRGPRPAGSRRELESLPAPGRR